MTIEPINYENAMWNSVIEYAESCSWKAGPLLVSLIRVLMQKRKVMINRELVNEYEN